jgi:hypothetical protein
MRPGLLRAIVHLRSTITLERGDTVNCLECARVNDAVAAVGVCHRCGVGLCLDHLIEAGEYRVGGTIWACPHELPRVKPLHGVPAGIAATRRHHTAAAK